MLLVSREATALHFNAALAATDSSAPALLHVDRGNSKLTEHMCLRR